MLGPPTQTPIKRPHSLTPQSSLPSLNPQASFSSHSHPLPDRSDSAHSVGTFGQRINPTDQDIDAWDYSPPSSPIAHPQYNLNPNRIPVSEIFERSLPERSCPVDDMRGRRYPPPTAQIYPSVRSLSTDYSIETASKHSLALSVKNHHNQFYSQNTQSNASETFSSMRSKKNENTAVLSDLHLGSPEDIQPPQTTLTPVKTKESELNTHPRLSVGSILIECPYCKERVKTKVKYKYGKAVWVTAIGLLVISGGLLCWVPFCMREYFQDVVHNCPNCSKQIGRFHRFSRII